MIDLKNAPKAVLEQYAKLLESGKVAELAGAAQQARAMSQNPEKALAFFRSMDEARKAEREAVKAARAPFREQKRADRQILTMAAVLQKAGK